MLNVGVDIVEISRFQQSGCIDRVAEFFLTAQELTRARNDLHKFQFLASRFAVKEAVIKAMPEPIQFLDFEIIKVEDKPAVRFLDQKFNKYAVAVSLSHSLESAVGFAVVNY